MLNRFCGKSQLVLADSLQVREALMKKVSRERVGQELDGMFNGMHDCQWCLHSTDIMLLAYLLV